MSPQEMRDYCQSISPYQLKVQVRLKNGQECLIGKIAGVEGEQFDLQTEDKGLQQLRYAWVARITNA
jgi:hypothetical protein